MARGGGKPQPTITDDRALGSADIQRSLRFNIDDSAYLGRTSASASSTFTLSLWLKRGMVLAGDSRWQYIFAAGNNGLYFERRGGGFQINGTGGEITVATNFRDPSSWYHIVLSMNSGTATTYVNNSVVHNAVAGFSLTTGSDETRLGRRGNGNYPFDGYMAEVHLVDGQAYDPSYFGFTDPQTDIWMPKRYEGAYGTNGFYLDFSDNSSTATLGIDKSPNGNDFTLNNFSVSAGEGNDSLEDTPTNNFCTLNSLVVNGTETVNCTNGNLDFTADDNYQEVLGTMSVKTGKWYWEVKPTSNPTNAAPQNFGITRGTGKGENSYVGYDNNGNGYGYSYDQAGNVVGGGSGDGVVNGATLATGQTSFTQNDIIGVAVDIPNGYLIFYKNGAHLYTISGINSHDWFPAFSAYASGTFSVNFGQRPFSYTPPLGHKELCAKNLSPLLTSPSVIRPQKHFDTVLYTGDEASSRKISGLEFQPDFVWIKPRSTLSNHVVLDSVRGVHNRILPNNAGSNVNNTSTITAFNVDGFQIGNSSLLNTNSVTHVAWCWKAGGNSNTFNVDGVGYATAAAAGLDGGTANPTGASVNTEAGFSIVQFEAQSSGDITLSHGLGKKPEFWMWKSVDNNIDWYNYHHSLGYNAWLNNSSSAAATTGNDAAWKAEPTSTVFTHGSGLVNQNTIIMYMWTSIPGYSKIGSYVGNGASDGTYVDLGFRPAWLMVKKTSGANSWVLYDVKRSPENVVDNYLIIEGAQAESTNAAVNVDLMSNGFKFQSGYDIVNAGSYIYMAFAEQPGVLPFTTMVNAR